MTYRESQKLVDKLLSNPQLTVKYFPPFEIINQMAEELGEVSREVAHLHGHKKKKTGEVTEGLEAELGDLLFAMICLANSENLSLERGLLSKLEKFKKRDVKRFSKIKK